MKWKYLFLPLIALFAMGQAKEPEDLYLSVPHGSFPELTKFQWVGKLPRTGDQVSATFSLERDGWEVVIARRARHPVRILMRANRLARAHPERALLWASYDEEELHLDIPYGEAREDCFANGEDVFESVQMNIAQDGKLGVQDTRFVRCEATHDDVATRPENGSIVIAD